ncbi:MAG: Abi family protein [Bacteroidetes bacterium]|nr:Abi family protein [Bacteroidota bacterium]MCA6444088.1 Abi family protein [Bacteroidota bacterium]
MSKVPYIKPVLSYTDQLNQLKQRGLLIEDEAKANHLLEVISYYRLSGYWYPLLADKKNHKFKLDATFNTAFKLYCFDRELRQMVLAELEKIEVAIRAKMTHVLSQKHGAFWFKDSQLFSDPLKHANALSKIGEEFNRSDEDFIKAFKIKYSDPWPPSWMTSEITSFGSLSMLYKNLKPGKEKRDIAHYFGLPDSVFETWLHSIVYLRNVCAHHTRLWNRAMSIRPQAPRSPRKPWLNNTNVSNNRTYFILSMINYLLKTVNPKNTFRTRFKNLLGKYPNVDYKAIGFPKNWEQEPLWQQPN